MVLRDAIELWEVMNNENYWDKIYLPESVSKIVDRRTLGDYLEQQYGHMIISACDSTEFRKRILTFFQIHAWNIDKLAKSTAFEYEPLNDYHGIQELNRTLDRTTKDITDDDWTEKGRSYSQNANLVSAFNDNESPEQAGTDDYGNPIYRYKDTEHHRDLYNDNYSKSGTDDKIVDGKLDDIIGEKITKSGNTGRTYQSMIEEERKQAQFNIYKWIAKHFSIELLVCIW